MLHLVAPDRIHSAARRYIIQYMAIGAGHNGGIVSGLGASFYFQAIHTGIHQIVQMIDHAHIAGIHDIGALFVFKYGEILTRAFFLHQRILIAARLRASATVAVAAGHIV